MNDLFGTFRSKNTHVLSCWNKDVINTAKYIIN